MHSGSARLDQLMVCVSSFVDHTVTISDLDELAHYYANTESHGGSSWRGLRPGPDLRRLEGQQTERFGRCAFPDAGPGPLNRS